MKKVIVTGATGFIGKFLVRELVNQKIDVIALVRNGSKNKVVIQDLPIRIIDINIDDYKNLPSIVRDRDIDTVFHTAWQGVSNVDARNENIQLKNLQATLDLIDSMNVMGIQTFVGCGSMHEAEAKIEILEDKRITNLGYMYKAAKTAAHWMGKAKAGNYGIRFFWPLINTYGEEETSNRLINTVIRKLLVGIEPELSLGTQYYDFVHVSDVAKALLLIAEKGIDGTNYTIASGHARQLKNFLNELSDVVAKVTGKECVRLGFGKMKGNVISLPIETFDINKLNKDTGFRPQITFIEGVEKTINWIIKNEETGVH